MPNPKLHFVVLYRNDPKKLFSLTARMIRARLPGVNAQMRKKGFVAEICARDMSKDDAELLKSDLRKKWEKRGYAYKTRKPLPKVNA